MIQILTQIRVNAKKIKQNFKPQYLQGAGTLINFMGKYQLYMLQFHFMEYTL